MKYLKQKRVKSDHGTQGVAHITTEEDPDAMQMLTAVHKLHTLTAARGSVEGKAAQTPTPCPPIHTP